MRASHMLFFLPLIASVPAYAAEPVQLQPAGPWRIDYTENSCLLSRPFTANGQAHNLVTTFEPLQGRVWMRLSSPEELRKRDDEEIQVDVDGVALSQPIHMNVLKRNPSGTVREFWFRTYWSDVAKTEQSLRFRTAKHGDIQVNATGLAKAMTSVSTCIDDLHASLGINPLQLRSIKSWPEGHAGKFLDVRLQHDGDSFTYRILYWVGADGKVDECRLLEPTEDPKFDASACAKLKKDGEFVPARNFAGAPVRAPVYENATIRQVTMRY